MKAFEAYENWVYNVKDEELKKELLSLADDEKEINNRFFKTIEFGTAGLRGILGAGTNYLNIYIIRRATKGIALYMRENNLDKVAISYDSRKMSRQFAIETAEVLAKCGIHSYISEQLQPTPFLSYMVRELKCNIGVMITASHNPAQYNGYKVYGNDGCQITSKVAEDIINKIEDCSFFGIEKIPFEEALSKGLAHFCPDYLLDNFIECGKKLQFQKSITNLKVVYTPLNGTGWQLVPRILRDAGVEVVEVEEQKLPDENFTTCQFPNPELKEALSLGLKYGHEVKADLLIATDPDCDRVGVAVFNSKQYKILSGNEIGILLLDYLLARRKQLNKLPEKGVVVRSIVSSILADKIADYYGVEMIKTLTGFKYIGEYILKLEKSKELERFIFGFEESCGYLAGTFVRDKEGVSTSLLVAEMASFYKNKELTLIDRLEEIYCQYGLYRNHTCDFYFEGANGFTKMNEILDSIRQKPFTKIASRTVEQFIDYEKPNNDLPKANMFEFKIQNGEQIIIRPSGTEPKVKVYITTTGDEEGSKNRLEEYDRFIEELFFKK